MDTPNTNQNLKICKNHNQPIILLDQKQNKPLCVVCIQEQTGMIAIDQVQQQLQETKIKIDKEFKDEQLLFQQLLDSIHSYKQNIINGIDKIIQMIIDQIENIKLTKEKLEKQFESNNQFQTHEQLNKQLINYEDNHKQVKNEIKQLLTDFQQKYINFDYLNQILTQTPVVNQNKIKTAENVKMIVIQEVKQERIYNQGKFQYELIRECGIIESYYCRAFAFNKDNTILIVGCNSILKIYQFLNGKIGKELQVLSNHKDWVYCLYYMQKSNCFVSGSGDHSIIIWKNENNNQWSPQQILTDHQDQVNCLVMNKNENLLISGSYDETIKFWKQVNDKWSCYQTIQTDNYVNAMSLNEMENKLITCGNGAYIYVMEINDDQQWSVKQKINVNESGKRLCFTFGDKFVYQPKTKDYLEVFDYDSKSNQFKKLSQVQIQSCQICDILFPCQYVKSLNILFVKHGQFLNIFKVNEEKNYELIQTIQYEHYNQYGNVSNDGQHLITWDKGSKEIQVRRLKVNE